jgi:hypothetical protein
MMTMNHQINRAWAATRKGLFELRLSGPDDWRIAGASFLGEPVSMLLAPKRGEGFMLAALNLGHFGVKLHASDDAGAHWREVSTPAYPPQPESDKGVPWKLVQIWSLAAASDGMIWAGTLPGGLFNSNDRGASWHLNESLWQRPERAEWFGGGYDVPGIHSICPHPERAGEVLVGISCGGAWITLDAGASWTPHTRGMRAPYVPPERAEDPSIQDPHCIARCEGAPDALWCQHHAGIWRSTDNAAAWQPVENVPVSAFGFAVAAHPREPGTAWFAPALADQCRVPRDGALVVNRTRDGGASFETLRDGLPQADCYDLVYRHGLVVADDGASLLMGSTSGGLWASGDAGQRWRTISLTLPPIYALRFG